MKTGKGQIWNAECQEPVQDWSDSEQRQVTSSCERGNVLSDYHLFKDSLLYGVSSLVQIPRYT